MKKVAISYVILLFLIPISILLLVGGLFLLFEGKSPTLDGVVNTYLFVFFTNILINISFGIPLFHLTFALQKIGNSQFLQTKKYLSGFPTKGQTIFLSLAFYPLLCLVLFPTEKMVAGIGLLLALLCSPTILTGFYISKIFTINSHTQSDPLATKENEQIDLIRRLTIAVWLSEVVFIFTLSLQTVTLAFITLLLLSFRTTRGYLINKLLHPVYHYVVTKLEG